MEEGREKSVVQKVFSRMKDDGAFRAALKRADNPATEYQSWEYLADYGVDLDKDYIRLPYATVFAAMARSGMEGDGTLTLGRALCDSYEEGRKSQPARSKLRRIIACSDVRELCAVLRPILQFIASGNARLCFGELLKDLLHFGDGEWVKSRWAQQFYGGNAEPSEGEE